MDRRLLFPATAVTALAQTTSPANAEAEKALRARAEQFYQLELKENFRQAEALVAEESKDYFYNSGKPKFKGYTINRIELTDNATRATVYVTVKVELMAPALGPQVFDGAATSTWKLENGQWCWYFVQDNTMMTPFGKMKFDPSGGGGVLDIAGKSVDPSNLQSLVSIDRRSVTLTAGQPEQTVTLSNNLPGAVTLALSGGRIDGLTTELEKSELPAGDKALIHFRRVGGTMPSGTVVITASPLNVQFEVKVKSE